MMIVRWTISVTLLAQVTGCLYDDEATGGLPCNVDADCDALHCIEGLCGGPSDGFESDSNASDESGNEDGDRPPAQEPPQQCTPGTQECIASNVIQICSDDRKLSTWECEAYCGMDDRVDGGCQTNPHDGLDRCWCESTGGPPSTTCQQHCSNHSDCSLGESCFPTTEGNICLPVQCSGCFSNEQICQAFTLTCGFVDCA